MEINKRDLKKLSLAFRTIANQTINAHYDEADARLKRFIEYIDSNYLISSYMNSIAEVEKLDVAKEINDVMSGHGRVIFNIGSSSEEEIVNTYKILKYMVDEKVTIRAMGIAYGNSTKLQDGVKGFCVRVVLPLVNHIELYLNGLGIDMGLDEEAKYMISVNGGQVNIAKDQATINATQYNGLNVDELDKLVKSIKILLATDAIKPEEREIINDNVEALQEELKKESPKKGFIKTAIKGLQDVYPKIAGAVELMAAITGIIQFAMTIL